MIKKIIFNYLPPILWAIVIFILSSVPGNDYPPVFFDYSYLAHFIEFFILAILILRALGIKEKKIYLSLAISAIYALSDELHQTFVVDRSVSVLDWLVDFLGIVTGLKLGIYLYFKKEKSHLSNNFSK